MEIPDIMHRGTGLQHDNDLQTATCPTGENGVAGDMFFVHFHVDRTPTMSRQITGNRYHE